MSSPSAILRGQIESKLTNGQYGFNATYAAVAPQYPAAKPVVLDFSPRSQNFFKSRIELDDLVGSSSHKFPLATLCIGSGATTNTQKFTTFSGLLVAEFKMHLTYNKAQALQDTENWADAIEDTVVTLFNRTDIPGWQSWGSSVAYNGQMAFERRALVESASNWLQTLYYRMTFEAVVK
jgi:hypothetical protein